MKLAMVKEVLSPVRRAECLGEVPLLLLRWEDQVTAAVDLAGAQVGDRVLLAFGSTGRPDVTADAAVVAVLAQDLEVPASSLSETQGGLRNGKINGTYRKWHYNQHAMVFRF